MSPKITRSLLLLTICAIAVGTVYVRAARAKADAETAAIQSGILDAPAASTPEEEPSSSPQDSTFPFAVEDATIVKVRGERDAAEDKLNDLVKDAATQADRAHAARDTATKLHPQIADLNARIIAILDALKNPASPQAPAGSDAPAATDPAAAATPQDAASGRQVLEKELDTLRGELQALRAELKTAESEMALAQFEVAFIERQIPLAQQELELQIEKLQLLEKARIAANP